MILRSLVLVILFGLMGCSSNDKKPKKVLRDFSDGQKVEDCHTKDISIGQKHLIISAMNKSRVLARCFDNYMKFEQDKSKKVFTCNVLTIGADGNVDYVYSRGQFGSDLPKDLKMCIEQEMWKMNFSGLQLSNTLTIQFPIEFNSN